MKKLFNKTILFNICIFLTLIYIIFILHQNFYLRYHDYHWAYLNTSDIDSLIHHWLWHDRKLATILCFAVRNYLPLSLNINMQENISNGFGAITISIILFLASFSAAAGFYINSKKQLWGGVIYNKESLLILPLTVFVFLIFYTYSLINLHLDNSIDQIIVYLEYFTPIIFYFLFFCFLFYILFKEEKINIFIQILIILNSFLLGFWSELCNLAALFSILAFVILMKFVKSKEYKLQIKNFMLLVLPFLIGLILFYITSQYMNGLAGLQNINWHESIANMRFINFLGIYINYMFLKHKTLYMIIFLLSFFLLRKRNEKTKVIIITNLSVILGFLMTNFIFVFMRALSELIERPCYQFIYNCVLFFVIIILLGCVYFQYNKNRKLILGSIITFFLIITGIFFVFNKNFQEILLRRKILLYRVEKICIIYNGIFKEYAIIPKSYIEGGLRDIGLIDIYYNHEINKLYSGREYYRYFNSNYKLKSIGYIFKDDNYANIELEKRLKILGKENETDEELIKNKISFKPLNKYAEIKLSLDDLNKIKTTDDIADVLLKTKASINYINGNLNEALQLYNDYLKLYGNDSDTLWNIAFINMYIKIQKKLNNADFINSFYYLSDINRYINYKNNNFLEAWIIYKNYLEYNSFQKNINIKKYDLYEE